MATPTKAGPKLLMLVGIIAVVLGVLALVNSFVAGTWVAIIIGSLLLVHGIVQLFHGWRAEEYSHRFGYFGLGGLTAISGACVLANPYIGLKALTIVMTIFFVVEGAWKIYYAWSYRATRGWLAVLLSGVLTLLLGLSIWSQWPFSAMYAVGILVGVDLVFTGVSLILLAMTVSAFTAVAEEKLESAE